SWTARADIDRARGPRSLLLRRRSARPRRRAGAARPMAARGVPWATMRFLNVPYGAWLARDVPAPDPVLTRTDPGTPCGEYLRRFWQPVAFARDLGDVPRRIRIMG